MILLCDVARLGRCRRRPEPIERSPRRGRRRHPRSALLARVGRLVVIGLLVIRPCELTS